MAAAILESSGLEHPDDRERVCGMPFEDHPLPAAFHVEPIVPRKPGRGGNHPPRKKKGAINKLTRDVKAGILDGAIAYGSDGEGTGGLTGYFEMCAARYPKQYMYLLGKLVPLNITGDGAAGHQTLSVNIISVPTDTYLSSEDMARLRGSTQTIEHVPQAIAHEPAPELAPKPASDRLAALEARLATLPRADLLRLAGVTDEDDRCSD